MDRTILHCDCNGYFASCECVLEPWLRNVPMAVGGDPEKRHGIILAKNELAKKYNIKTAETIAQAKAKCPQLVIVPPHHDVYREFSHKINAIYREYTDFVEPFSIDESWLDVTGSRKLFGDGKTIADKLRSRVRTEIGVTISVGVSFNKIFAKLGSDYKKPDATTVISRENYKETVYPLKASDMIFVGKSTLAVLERYGIKTIGDIAARDREFLQRILGKTGEMLYVYANGLDASPVRTIYDYDEAKSIGNGETFSHDLSSEAEVKDAVMRLSESIAARMRANCQKCTTVQVQIRNPQFRTISRQKKTGSPTYSSRAIASCAMELINASYHIASGIRMLTVTGQNLVKENEINVQMSLLSDVKTDERSEKIEKTMDSLKERFGSTSVVYGNSVKAKEEGNEKEHKGHKQRN